MKYLKYYESISEIDRICKEYDIENYKINSDGSIDVNDDVNLSRRELTELPIRFNYVGGNFDCQLNKLTNLVGAPKSVGGDFDCQSNDLTTLVGAPKSVGSDFDCRLNKKLTSLLGAPLSIGKEFKCEKTPVYSVWELFKDKDKLYMFNDYDIIRDESTISLYRLNEFLEDIGKSPVESVKGYKMI